MREEWVISMGHIPLRWPHARLDHHCFEGALRCEPIQIARHVFAMPWGQYLCGQEMAACGGRHVYCEGHSVILPFL